MVRVLLLLSALLSIIEASNLRLDSRFVINETLLKLQRSKNNSYPIKSSHIKDSTLQAFLEDNQEPVYGYADSNNAFNFHTRVGGRSGLEDDSIYIFSTYYDFNFRGNFHSLEFDLSARNNLDYYSEDVVERWHREDYSSPYYNTDTKDSVEFSSSKLWDENRFNIVYSFDNGSIEAGHGQYYLGPSLFDNLFISQKANGFDYYAFDYTFGQFTFTGGMLGLVTDSDQEQKNLAFHRLDFNNSFLNVGMYEGVVFKDRMPLMYLVPVVPFIFSEHYYGDVDNNNMGIDISLFYKGAKLYSDLFIDDMYSLSSFFDDTWWGNKWGATVGGSYTKKITNESYFLAGLEYTRVMPWVYTHHDDSGAIRYTHYGKELGYSGGSDSDRLNGIIEFGAIGKFSMTTVVSKVRQGPVSTFAIHDDKIHGLDREFLATKLYNNIEFTSEIKAFVNIWRINVMPRLSIGGDRDIFLKNFQFGMDIEY